MNDSILVRFDSEIPTIIPMTFQFRPQVGESINFDRREYKITKIEHFYQTNNAMIHAQEVE